MQKVIARNEKRLFNLKTNQNKNLSDYLEIKEVLIRENGWNDIYMGLENECYTTRIKGVYTGNLEVEFIIHPKMKKLFYGFGFKHDYETNNTTILDEPVTSITQVLLPRRKIAFIDENSQLDKLYIKNNIYAWHYFNSIIGKQFEITGDFSALNFAVKEFNNNNLLRLPYEILTIPKFTFLSPKS